MKKTFLVLLLLLSGAGVSAQTPRIVNIVNFIRLLEPRDSSVTEDVLCQTVVRQVSLMRDCRLRACATGWVSKRVFVKNPPGRRGCGSGRKKTGLSRR